LVHRFLETTFSTLDGTFDDTQHSQQKNIHASGGIRTRSANMRATADLRFRGLGNWDRHMALKYIYQHNHQLPTVEKYTLISDHGYCIESLLQKYVDTTNIDISVTDSVYFRYQYPHRQLLNELLMARIWGLFKRFSSDNMIYSHESHTEAQGITLV
jgi:hypothetical protein